MGLEVETARSTKVALSCYLMNADESGDDLIPSATVPIDAHLDDLRRPEARQGATSTRPTSRSRWSTPWPRPILVEGTRFGMQAFMAGKIKVEGDMAKLMMSRALRDETPRKSPSDSAMTLSRSRVGQHQPGWRHVEGLDKCLDRGRHVPLGRS